MGEADEDGDSSPPLEDPDGWLRSPLEEPRSPPSSRSCRGRRVTGGAHGLEPSSLDITAMSWMPVWRKVIVRSSWGSEQALASSEDRLTDTAQGWPPIVFTTGKGTFKTRLWPILSRYQRYRWYRRRRFDYMDDDFDDDYYTTYYQRLDIYNYKSVGLPAQIVREMIFKWNSGTTVNTVVRKTPTVSGDSVSAMRAWQSGGGSVGEKM